MDSSRGGGIDSPARRYSTLPGSQVRWALSIFGVNIEVIAEFALWVWGRRFRQIRHVCNLLAFSQQTRIVFLHLGPNPLHFERKIRRLVVA